MSTHAVSGGGWNVAIFCADTAAGKDAQQQLEDTLAAFGLRVQCHVRQWRFAELGQPSVYEAAVDHALDADLVVLAGHDIGPVPDELQAVLAEWLIRCGAEASPLAVTLDCGAPGEEVFAEILTGLRRLTDRAHVPLYTSFGDALVVAWDLWEWKHFPWAAAATEISLRSRSEALSVGQRHAAKGCRGAYPSRARAETGGTVRHALDVSRQRPSVRRCQP